MIHYDAENNMISFVPKGTEVNDISPMAELILGDGDAVETFTVFSCDIDNNVEAFKKELDDVDEIAGKHWVLKIGDRVLATKAREA